MFVLLGHYVIVPKKVPEFIVPDLTGCEVSLLLGSVVILAFIQINIPTTSKSN